MTSPEEAHFRAMLRGCAEDLLAYFERRVRIKEDAADMLAETMLQAWRRIDAAPGTAERQRMWLFRIAAYVLNNHQRGTRRRRALAEQLGRHLAVNSGADEEQAREVRDAVLRLPDAHRELVCLVHWEGFTIVDAAELLDLNTSTARSRYAAARCELKKALSTSVRG